MTLGGLALTALASETDAGEPPAPQRREPTFIRAAFVYPPSEAFAGDPDGWWSWPGNEFDAEGRQKKYTDALVEMQKNVGVRVAVDDRPIAASTDADRLGKQLATLSPNGQRP